MTSSLRLEWVSHQAATFACKAFHYSHSMPCPPTVRLGVFEDGMFIGAVVFARGANKSIGSPYGLQPIEVAELARVALREHETPVSRIISVAVKLLRRHCPGLRLIVSFADPEQGHHGGVYQAAGWSYLGETAASQIYVDPHGRRWHPRMVSTTGLKRVYGELRKVVRTADCRSETVAGKHRYALPLDDAMRERLARLARPYPKRGRMADSGRPAPTGRGGANPTRPLHDEAAHV